MPAADRLEVHTVATMYLENTGDGRFDPRALPRTAQISAVTGAVPADFDGDGAIDLVVAGNIHAFEHGVPRLDAGVGVFLRGDGAGGFRAEPPRQQRSLAGGAGSPAPIPAPGPWEGPRARGRSGRRRADPHPCEPAPALLMGAGRRDYPGDDLDHAPRIPHAETGAGLARRPVAEFGHVDHVDLPEVVEVTDACAVHVHVGSGLGCIGCGHRPAAGQPFGPRQLQRFEHGLAVCGGEFAPADRVPLGPAAGTDAGGARPRRQRGLPGPTRRQEEVRSSFVLSFRPPERDAKQCHAGRWWILVVDFGRTVPGLP